MNLCPVIIGGDFHSTDGLQQFAVFAGGLQKRRNAGEGIMVSQGNDNRGRSFFDYGGSVSTSAVSIAPLCACSSSTESGLSGSAVVDCT